MKGTVLGPLSFSSHPLFVFLHVLGGWQDLREECIKLKKRVFDLERQNQMLSALFQQKLQLTTGSLPQVGSSTSPSLSIAQLPAPAQPHQHHALFSKTPVEAGCQPFPCSSPAREGPPSLIDRSFVFQLTGEKYGISLIVVIEQSYLTS